MFSTQGLIGRLAAIWAGLAGLVLGPAQAAMLDPIACDALKAERARIETDALKSDMAKGPEWAKANMTAERLKEVEQVIGLQEMIAFRCPVPKPPPVKAGVQAGKPSGHVKNGTATGKDASAQDDDGKPEQNPNPAASSKTASPDKPKAGDKQRPSSAAVSAPSKTGTSTGTKSQAGTASQQAVKPATQGAGQTSGQATSKKKVQAAPLKPTAEAPAPKSAVSDAYVPPPAVGVAPGLTP